ncbi:hypothetical protein IFR08_09810 [Pseudomonas fluorescens]|uniref:hypothetical protein n=1 Tax=Pseudomonas fluorescens TaxID=294 RepID=UPI001785AFD4|nr:hypothetical protein [Pseudomonas fluorescens]MBD8099145.1 hypothetical protein [Pseudomonas fluorescens]MBD8774064.1 hypothetical protein [Pseudomonas fluorescens]MBD8780906.1 hypothetical protein [Pseudomonas fluorescens]MBD8796783.1 hypothetical protein [Pseudomonas fluorescens]
MKDQRLDEILQRMLNENINISARSVTREIGSPFKHASDVTRQPERKALLDQYQKRQRELRVLMEKTDKQSRTNLQAKVARLTQENYALKGERDLLVSSHKAMLLAVGEMGGISAWRKFFPVWEETREQLRQLQALPNAEILSTSKLGKS